jgi:hypothetical protein
MNETKIKGLTTELQCQLFFTQLGYNVSVPLGEDCRYDMIVDFDGVLCRIQVKTCHINSTNTGIEFATRSTQVNATCNITKTYSKEEIDYFATFWNNQCYLVKVEECSTTKTLRFENKRVNQVPICFIEDYEAIKQIEKIKCGNDEPLKENKVYQYDLRNNLIATFSSCREAARSLGDIQKNAHINQVIQGQRKTAYGYKWTTTLIKS